MKRRARVGGRPWAIDLGRIGDWPGGPRCIMLY